LGTPKIGTSKGKPKQSANKVIAGICLAASSMGKFHFLWMGARPFSLLLYMWVNNTQRGGFPGS